MANEFLEQFMAGWQMGQGRVESQRRNQMLQMQQQEEMARQQQQAMENQMRQEEWKLRKQEADLNLKKAQFDAKAQAAAMTSRQQQVAPPEMQDLGGGAQLDMGPAVQERAPIMAEVPGAEGVPPVQLPFMEDIQAMKEAEMQRKMREALGMKIAEVQATRKTPAEIEAEAEARARGERRGAPPVGAQGSWSDAVGPDGKPILFNATTGGTRAYPEGVRPKPSKVTTPTGVERQGLAYYHRAKEAVENAMPIEEEIAKAGLAKQLGLSLPNIIKPTKLQRYTQAQRAFTEARLRKESGAAIPPAEFENDRTTYWAMPGDSKETIRQKQVARETVLDGMASSSGKAYEEFYGEPAPRGGQVPPGGGGDWQTINGVRVRRKVR